MKTLFLVNLSYIYSSLKHLIIILLSIKFIRMYCMYSTVHTYQHIILYVYVHTAVGAFSSNLWSSLVNYAILCLTVHLH